MRKLARGLAALLLVGTLLLSPLEAAMAATSPDEPENDIETPIAAQEAEDEDVIVPAENEAELVAQNLDYTENPADVPNADRGFYRANDAMIVPVSGAPSGSMTLDTTTTVSGASVTTRVSHVYFDLRNFSSNAATSRGTRYNDSYRAPANVAIASRGDENPEYETHFEYWQENVFPTWPHGTSQPLTADALAYITHKLDQVRAGSSTTLVRFNYDGGGYGWVDVDHPEDGYIDQSVADIEPDKETMLGHIAQLKPILQEYEDIIMGVDGGMFGPWGEMHSTTFGTSTEANAWLLDAWLDAVPESRSIIVQGGAFLSWYNNYYGTDYTFWDIDKIPTPEKGTPEARFGFFNDSYAYGEDEGDDYPNDWGSLSEGAGWPGDPLGDEDSYDRGRIMTWIRKQNNFYGGEAQGDETLWNTYPFVAWEASYAQTVYLNLDYERQVHNRWRDFIYTEENVTQEMTNLYEEPYDITDTATFDPVYDGKTGMEYWRDRLGFRLVMRDANASEWVSAASTLAFEGKIQNVGFGNVVNKKNVTVILKDKDSSATYSVLTDIDARDWRPDLDSRATNENAWRDLNFTIDMSEFGAMDPGDYDIYLKINDPKEKSENKRCIRFANNGGIWDAALGANLIGSTTVLNTVNFTVTPANALVEVKATDNTVYTADENGNVYLPDGTYTYTVKANTYLPKSDSIVVSGNDSVTVTLAQAATLTDIAANTTYIAPPAKDATSLALPEMPAGHTVAIKAGSISPAGVLVEDGSIVPPAADTTVTLVLTITKTGTDPLETADTGSITVAIPARTPLAADVAGGITAIAAPAAGDTELVLPQVPEGLSIGIKSVDPAGVIGLDGAITVPAVDTTVQVVLTVTRAADGTTADTATIAVVVPGKVVRASEIAAGITSIVAPEKDATSLALPAVPDGFTVSIKSVDPTGVIALNGTITPPRNTTTVKVVLNVRRTADRTSADTAPITVVVPAKTVSAADIASDITGIAPPAKDATSLALPTVPEGFTVAIKSVDPTGVIALDGTITPPTAETDVKVKLTVTRTSDSTTADTAEFTVKVPRKTLTLQDVVGLLESDGIDAPAKNASQLTLPEFEGFGITIKSALPEGVIGRDGSISVVAIDTDVDIVLTVTDKTTRESADTGSIRVTVLATSTPAEIAAGLSIPALEKNQLTLTLPEVPQGFTVRIQSVTPKGIIAVNGNITLPYEDKNVTVILTVRRLIDGAEANTSGLSLLVPERLDAATVAAGVTGIETPVRDATELVLPEVPDGFKVGVYSVTDESVIKKDGTIVPPYADTPVSVALLVTRIEDGDTATTSAFSITVPEKTVKENTSISLNYTELYLEPNDEVDVAATFDGDVAELDYMVYTPQRASGAGAGQAEIEVTHADKTSTFAVKGKAAGATPAILRVYGKATGEKGGVWAEVRVNVVAQPASDAADADYRALASKVTLDAWRTDPTVEIPMKRITAADTAPSSLLKQGYLLSFAPAKNANDASIDDLVQNFYLVAKDDSTILLVPRDGVTNEALNGLKASYKMRIQLRKGTHAIVFAQDLTLAVNKKMPSVKLANITINTFFDDKTAAITLTSGSAEKIELNPDQIAKNVTPLTVQKWLAFDAEAQSVEVLKTDKTYSSSLYLLVTPEGWAKSVAATVKVTAKSTTPAVKLASAAAKVLRATEKTDGVPMKLQAKAKGYTLADLGVLDLVEAPVEAVSTKTYAAQGLYKVDDFKPDGTFNIKPADGVANADLKNGKLLLWAQIHGGGVSPVTVSVTVLNENTKPSLAVSKTSLKLNPQLQGGESYSLAVSASNIPGYKLDGLTVELKGTDRKNPDTTYDAIEATPSSDGKSVVVKVLPTHPGGKTYSLTLFYKYGEAASNVATKKVTVTVPAKTTANEASVSLGVKGNMNLTTGVKARITATFKNYLGGFVDDVPNFLVKDSKGDNLSPAKAAAFEFTKVDSGWEVGLKDGAEKLSPATYTLWLEDSELVGGTKVNTARGVKLVVKASMPKVTQSAKTVTMYTNDPYSEGIITLSVPEGTAEISTVTLTNATYELIDLGGNRYAVCFKDKANVSSAKKAKVKLAVTLEGNEQSVGTISLTIAPTTLN